jgi:hypothetical protein
MVLDFVIFFALILTGPPDMVLILRRTVILGTGDMKQQVALQNRWVLRLQKI